MSARSGLAGAGVVSPGSATARLLAEAARLEARAARCHEEVGCPRCGAPVGHECRKMPQGFTVAIPGTPPGRPLKHPHRERWTLVVPAR